MDIIIGIFALMQFLFFGALVIGVISMLGKLIEKKDD